MPNNPNFNEFFKEFKLGSKIFADYHYLTPEYNPEKIINRETQINQICTELIYSLNHNTIPKNFLLYGITGTGKTATMQYILQKIKQWSIKENKPIPIFFFNNCAIFNTPYRIFRELCRLLNTYIPRTGLSTEIAYTQFIDAVKRNKDSRIILVLDELDFLFRNKRIGNDLLYKLIRPPLPKLISLKISIFGITNDLSLKDSFDTRIKSSLNPEEIYFPPYSALELQKILSQRAIKAFKSNVLASGLIEFIAAYFAQHNGDARQAITVLRVSSECADKAKESKVLEKHVKMALKKYFEIQKQEIIQSLPYHSKKILQSIKILQERTKVQFHITGNVYNEYVKLCQQAGHSILGFRQFNNHIKKLEHLNLINTEPTYRGRRGNTRKITFYFS